MVSCELAETVNHPLTTCYATGRACWLDAMRGDMGALQDHCQQLSQVTRKFGFKNFELAAVFFENLARLGIGNSPAEAVQQMHSAMQAYHATGTVLNRTGFLVFFAQACGIAGQIERSLEAANESIRLGEETGERWFEAEAYRVKGDLLVKQAGKPGLTWSSEAESCYQNARQVAIQQEARMFELRAVTSLVRLWQGQGRDQAGREMLAHIIGWFSEGQDSDDFCNAMTLLEEFKE
jgi:predicted ATPase